MVKFSRDSVVDVNAYDKRLNRLGYILYDREVAQNILSYMESRSSTLAERAAFIMKLNSGCKYFNLHKESVFRYLVECEWCPERYFYTKKAKSFSLDMKNVLTKLVSNGKAVEFLTEYMEHRSMRTKCSSLKTIVGNCKTLSAKGRGGNDLCRIGFEASQQKNLRFNYRQYDIISQFPKEACDSISVDDGYFLAWGDFAQSDFRIAYNLFLRNDEHDEIMNRYNDKYEALARIVKQSLGQEFDLEQFKTERQVYKRMTLATVYGTRTSPIKEEKDFIESFVKFLEKCPKYSEYYRRLQVHLCMKSPIAVRSYFGHTEYIPYNYDKQSVVNDALNSPVQSGTSEVVILTVNSILDLARSMGLSEDQFGVYMVRHDEPVFRISKDALPFVWILQQHNQILVDNWTPLQMDFQYGYRYKVVDEVLQGEAERVYRQNEGRITKLDYGNRIDTGYYPVKPLLCLAVHWVIAYDKTVMAFYESGSGAALFSLLETTDQTEIIKQMRIRIAEAENRISRDYQGVFVRNACYDAEDFFGDTHVVYCHATCQEVNQAAKWCRHMAYLYCRDQGLEPPLGVAPAEGKMPVQLHILNVEGQ